MIARNWWAKDGLAKSLYSVAPLGLQGSAELVHRPASTVASEIERAFHG